MFAGRQSDSKPDWLGSEPSSGASPGLRIRTTAYEAVSFWVQLPNGALLGMVLFMATKKCSRCRETKLLALFYRKRDQHDCYCKPCRNVISKEHYEANKQQYVQKAHRNNLRYIKEYRGAKEREPCMDCGGYFHFASMQYDHIGPKTRNVSTIATSRQLLALELKYCELVCANCHAVRTWKRTQPS